MHYASIRITVDAADLGQIDPDRISRIDTIRIIQFRIWKPEPFPLIDHDDHYRLLLGEVLRETIPQRRDRAYPRVIKRKMSNFPVKTIAHRQRRQPSRPLREAVTITPPSKTRPAKRPAKIL